MVVAWLQNNLLPIAAITITLILIYHYFIERGSGPKLSKRYRNSIFEAQSKIFLSATQYLISGNRDLAIKEFLNAVDLNRETIETYFALGGLFRSNGEIEKAISIHRGLIARDNISESTRLKALRELALDFDKGGFVDKAIETYIDVLKINRDQYEVIQNLCRIYEDIEDWDSAYTYRVMLSKVGIENQAETISHILVQKAKKLFERGEFNECNEELEDAFRFAPSVSAKILRLKLYLIHGQIEDSKALFLELLREHPLYTSFVFVSLGENFKAEKEIQDKYQMRLSLLKDHFLDFNDKDLMTSPSLVLARVRLLKESGSYQEAYEILKDWIDNRESVGDALKVEFIKLLIDLNKKEEIISHTKSLIKKLNETLARYFCSECGYDSDAIFWRCPSCKDWETIQYRWKV